MPAPSKITGTAATSAKPKGAGRFITVAEGRKITLAAKGWKGTPYAPQQKDGKLVTGSEKYAGGNPVKGKNGGADCSGSVWAIYKEAGFSYGHYFNSVAFVNWSLPIRISSSLGSRNLSVPGQASSRANTSSSR